MWVRGLKLHERIYSKYLSASHPMWVRGLKPSKNRVTRWTFGRTLCGCVD